MSKFDKLKAAVERLYYAAYWRPDRECDATKLWEDVRDAAGFPPGQTLSRLGPVAEAQAEVDRLRVLNAKLLAVVEKIWHCVPGEEPDALWDQIATIIEHAKGRRR